MKRIRDHSFIALAVLTVIACGQATENGVARKTTLQPQPAVPSPGAPTTLRVVLQLQTDGTLQLVSAEPKRGSLETPALDENRDKLLSGALRLVEYRATDAAGTILATGLFFLPLKAESEFQDPNVETRLRRREETVIPPPTVKVSIPYRAEITRIGFQGLEPDAQTDARQWKRIPMGEVTVGRKSDATIQ